MQIWGTQELDPFNVFVFLFFSFSLNALVLFQSPVGFICLKSHILQNCFAFWKIFPMISRLNHEFDDSHGNNN